MKKSYKKIVFGILIVGLLLLSSTISAYTINQKNTEEKNITITNNQKIKLEFNFSDPILEAHDNYTIIRVTETNHNKMALLTPILVKL